ncbi:MAG: PQQ-binding-like beta-propeller repeat protein [Planctomycetaceae bacterium]|nr:PQQ-binding-like beta-propeller repeat protein [Planctomycetaceae bacterium]
MTSCFRNRSACAASTSSAASRTRCIELPWLAPVCGVMLTVLLAGCGAGAPSTTKTAQAADDTAQSQTPAAGVVAGKKVSAVSATEPAPPARSGEDWPVFLGSQHTGVAGETGISFDWPKNGPPVLWKKTVGTGYSAPSVRGNRLVIHHRPRSQGEIVSCLRADTGEPLWEYSYASSFSDPYGYNNGPRCTPLLTEDRCYTFGAEGKLLCLNLADGKKVWERDTSADWKVTPGFFGVGATPVLEEGLLYVLVGGQPNSGVVAFRADNGETVWENSGKSTWDGAATDDPGKPTYEWTGEEMVVSYSSPLVATIHGRKHLLCLMRQGLVSLDPATGKEQFHHWFRSRTYESVNAARPVVIGSRIFLSAAYKTGSVLLEVAKDGQSVKEVWQDRRNLLTHWSTPIFTGEHIYGFSGRHEREGELRCLSLETGKVVWSTTGFEGDLQKLRRDGTTGKIVNTETGEPVPFPFYGRGSKIQVGDHFIVLGERGTLAVVKISPEKWIELGRTSYDEISYPAWTAPVLSRQRIYLRDEDSLLCLDVAPQARVE